MIFNYYFASVWPHNKTRYAYTTNLHIKNFTMELNSSFLGACLKYILRKINRLNRLILNFEYHDSNMNLNNNLNDIITTAMRPKSRYFQIKLEESKRSYLESDISLDKICLDKIIRRVNSNGFGFKITSDCLFKSEFINDFYKKLE